MSIAFSNLFKAAKKKRRRDREERTRIERDRRIAKVMEHLRKQNPTWDETRARLEAIRHVDQG